MTMIGIKMICVQTSLWAKTCQGKHKAYVCLCYIFVLHVLIMYSAAAYRIDYNLPGMRQKI